MTKSIFIGVIALLIISAGINIAFLIKQPALMPGAPVPGITQPSPIEPSPISPKIGIQKFASEQEFKKYLEEAQGLENFGFGRLTTFGFGAAEAEAMSASPAGIGGATAKAAPDRVSQTNVQVRGIDEPDIVKTNGKEIYYSSDRRIFYPRPLPMPIFQEKTGILPPDFYPKTETKIIAAFPPKELAKKSGIDKSGNLLLYQNHLAIFSGNFIYGYNVSDPATPKEIWKIELENNNWVKDSRLYNGKIYLILQSAINYSRPCPIPLMKFGGAPIIIPCLDIYRPTAITPTDITYTAMIIDPLTGKAEKTATFTGSTDGSILYMSPNAIYLAYPQPADIINVLYGFLNQAGKDLVSSELLEKLAKLRTYDISNGSKITELGIIIERYYSSLNDDERLRIENEFANRLKDYFKEHIRELEKTQIVKIGLDSFAAEASGIVPGHLLNQFSMDEYQEHLRTAVTIGEQGGFWFGFGFNGSSESVNDIYVLDKNLVQTGSIKGLGLTERIYSARFVGNKGYIVTFRQTDPFYVLDLSNPQNPSLKGELKIPGFSSYLDPITENLVLGVGQESSQVKLSLFDVADPANPKEAAKYLLNEYWTEVSNNHHAFLLDDRHKVFFLPASKGGYIFSYENNKLTLKKAVSNIQAQRAIYLDDYMYIIGQDKIVVLDETTWNEINKLTFE